MSVRQRNRLITGDAPDTASGAVVGTVADGLEDWVLVNVTASLVGNTGGTLDVYLQRWDGGLEDWVDWMHFPQLASGASAIIYTVPGTAASASIYTVGLGTTVALAANSYTGGQPGTKVRLYAVSGTSTSAGATVSVSLSGTLS